MAIVSRPSLNMILSCANDHADWGSSLLDNEVGDTIWGHWITEALANGTLKPKPDPVVVGQGLESLQEALDKMGAGVSAQKLVVELP